MEQGYDDRRFEKPVDEDLHCVICTEVLKDPVQCRRNEHHFCRSCITRHLQHSQTCPTCKDPLTVETLGRPQRFLANTLSSLKNSCENFERGCCQVVKLGSLDTHVASCGFSPVPCSNDRCEEIINRRDKEIRENKVCGFRRVKCDYCSQVVQYMNLIHHTCPARREIREIKSNIAETNDELTEIRSTQTKMFTMMQNVISNLMRIERNMLQRPEANCVSSDQDLQAEIVVAGGSGCKSVEAFTMRTKQWRPLSEMNQYRSGASSILHQSHMFVIGGYSHQYMNTVEELKHAQQNGHWVEPQFKLPAPSASHACVVYQNRLLVISGCTETRVYNSIHEIQLTPPYTSRLLTTMPHAICVHGAEIVSDKVYIIGGSTTEYVSGTTNTVRMFDPATNTCTELKPLPYPVSSMATVTWKDNVVVLGGMDKEGNVLNTVILYKLTTGSHRMLPEMRKKRFGCTAVIIGDNIIVMGGYDETWAVLNSVECYNFNTNTWTEFPAMTEGRARATAIVKYC